MLHEAPSSAMTVTKAQQVAALFYRHCGHAGALRPEMFSVTALPEQFAYAYATHINYELSAATLLIHGHMLLAIPQEVPLWVLLHLDGAEGEIMSWINLQRLNPDTCKITPLAVPPATMTSRLRPYLVRFQGTDISKYAFVLRRYQQCAWAAYERSVADMCDNVILQEEEEHAPILTDGDSIPPLGWSRSRDLGHRMRSRAPLATS